MFRFINYCAVLTLLLAPQPAFTQNQTSAELKEIVVSATRVETSTLEAPTFSTVITHDQIMAEPAASVSDLLSREAGVLVNDSGPAGTVKSLSLRGSTGAQVLVLIDGIRLNSSRDGGVDLSLLPFADIERIEIVRGGGSSLYGADAVGGVVNIVTRRPSANSLSLKIVNGSYLPFAGKEVAENGAVTPTDARFSDLVDTQKVELAGTTMFGQTGLSAGGSFTRAANSYAWNDTIYFKDWRRRSHSTLMGGDAFAGVNLPLAGGELGLRGTFGYNQMEVLGPVGLAVFSNDAVQKSTSASFSGSFKTARFPIDNFSLDLKGYYRYGLLAYNDPVSPHTTFGASDDRHGTHSIGIDISQSWTGSDMFGLTYGAALANDAVDSTAIGARNRINAAGFLETPLYLLSNLTLTPSARYDYFTDFGGAATWRLSAVCLMQEKLAIKASGWSAFRAPTMNELYWPMMGNSNLKPETTFGLDGGVSFGYEPLDFDVFGFVRWVENNIVWDPNSNQLANIGRSLLPGAEIRTRLTLLDRFTVSAAYTFLLSYMLRDANNKDYSMSDDRRVPFIPVHGLNAGLEYKDGENRVGIDCRWNGPRFGDTDNSAANKLDQYFVLNAGYSRIFDKKLTLDVTVKNLLNSSYEDQKGYPMPPLSIWTSLQVKL